MLMVSSKIMSTLSNLKTLEELTSWSAGARHSHHAAEDPVEAAADTMAKEDMAETLEVEEVMEIGVVEIVMEEEEIAMEVVTRVELLGAGIQNQLEEAIAIEMKESKMEETKEVAADGPGEANGTKKISQLDSTFLRTPNSKSQRDLTRCSMLQLKKKAHHILKFRQGHKLQIAHLKKVVIRSTSLI
jgi:hypothetical protein